MCALHMHELHPWQMRIREGSFNYESVNVMDAWAAQDAWADQTCTHEGATRLLARVDVMLREDPAWAAQPCPACAMPQAEHTTYQAYVNRYAGSQSFQGAHLDGEPEGTTSVLVALPHMTSQPVARRWLVHVGYSMRWESWGGGSREMVGFQLGIGRVSQ